MTAQHLTPPLISLKEIDRNQAFSYMSEELKDRVFQDYIDLSINQLPINYEYIGCLINGELIGFIHLARSRRFIVDIHINFNKPKRGYAAIFAKKVIDNLMQRSDINRVESEIPVIYKSMLKFVQNLGFIVEGVKSEAFLKHNKWHDSYTIGLTRNNYGRNKLK